MDTSFIELKRRLMEVNDLRAAGSVLSWDQSTYMPPGGAEARARQNATLARLAHEKFTDPAVGKLLETLRPYEESLPFESDEASLIRVARRDFERATKVPVDFVAEFQSHSSESYQVWTSAREKAHFASVRPYLERTADLSRQYADFFPGYERIMDPMLERADEGWKTSEVLALFAELRRKLLPIVTAISSRPRADDSCLRQRFPESAQLAFGLSVVKQLGYDLTRGRQDKTHHPFTTTFSLGDVRITTRVEEDFLASALFATIHEAGHAIYEQGVSRSLDGTPLAGGTSSGVHESQSRLWENIVGRSKGFWSHFYPRLRSVFPDQLRSVPLDTFYRAINRVEPSLIRVEADEVTYNLHIMMRFELELDVLEGRLAVKDLPEAWRARMASDVGVVPPTDREGVLQDVHWYAGGIGGEFQGYTLGNILSAQLYEAALRARPEIPDQIERGEFHALREWLTERVYRHGRKFRAPELIERATGRPISVEPYVRYLRTKYGEIYGI